MGASIGQAGVWTSVGEHRDTRCAANALHDDLPDATRVLTKPCPPWPKG